MLATFSRKHNVTV